MTGDYAQYQKWNRSKTTDVEVLVGTANYASCIAVKSANHQLFIQKISLVIQTHAAHTITFKDTSSTPIVFGARTDAATAAGVADEVVFDFGPKGKACAAGKDFSVTQDATGIVGTVHIEAYEKIVSGAIHTGLASSAQ